MVVFQHGREKKILAEIAGTSDRVVLIEDTRELQCRAPNLVAVGIAPWSPSIVRGSTLQLTATGTYEDGTVADLTALAAAIPAPHPWNAVVLKVTA